MAAPGVQRLPDVRGDRPQRQKSRRYPIGYSHIDIAEVQTAKGKLCLFVGIGRTARFAVAQLVVMADRKIARGLLQHMLETAPFQGRAVLTDNGIQCSDSLATETSSTQAVVLRDDL